MIPINKLIIAFMLLCSPVLAEAKAVIKGPTQVAVNSLFFLSTEGTIGDNTEWILPDMSYAQEAVCGTTKFLVINKAGRYEFILIAADKDANISYVKHVVTVGNSGTTPSPEPEPEPGPKPPVPPVNFEKLESISRSTSQSLADPTTSSALVKNLTTVLASITPAVDMKTSTVLVSQAIESTFATRTGVSRTKDWLGIWRRPVNEELARLSAAGAIPSSTEYVQAITALIKGLQ